MQVQFSDSYNWYAQSYSPLSIQPDISQATTGEALGTLHTCCALQSYIPRLQPVTHFQALHPLRASLHLANGRASCRFGVGKLEDSSGLH